VSVAEGGRELVGRARCYVGPTLIRRCLADYKFHFRFEVRDVRRYLRLAGLEMTSQWDTAKLAYSSLVEAKA
jgi:hypothetical protein